MFGAVSSPLSSPRFLLSSSSSSSSSSKGRKLRASLPNHPPASRIFVRNLSYSLSEASLIKIFSDFGQIVEVKLAKHEETNRSKGYAFVQYSCQDDAVLAIEQMDHQRIDGRIVQVEIAKPLNNGFAAYPRSLGPPSPRRQEANDCQPKEEGVIQLD